MRLRTYPGYGYFLSQGYTTWPENWNTTVIHSHRGPVIPNSKMHGCYNGIGLWFVEGIAGIRVHASESPPLTISAGVDAGDLTWARGHRVTRMAAPAIGGVMPASSADRANRRAKITA